MSFFSQFPNRKYDLRGNNVNIEIKDIFRYATIDLDRSENSFNYNYYEVIEGERPDIVSTKLYGTPNYYWTFFLINESLGNGLSSWPKDPRTLELEMQFEYDNLGALVLNPQMKSTFTVFDNSPGNETPTTVNETHITNTFNGIDTTFSELRVKRNGALAKIKNWDSQKMQLVVGDFVTQNWLDGMHTMSDGTSMRGETHVPSDSTVAQAKAAFFAGTPGEHPLTLGFEDSPMSIYRARWVRGLSESVTKSFTNTSVLNDQLNLHENYFIKNDSPDSSPNSIIPIAETLFPFDASPSFGLNQSFSPSRMYENYREAPEYYYTQGDETNEISAYDAFNQDKVPANNSPDIGTLFSNSGPDVFVSKRQNLENLNFDNRRIKVIKPSEIQSFVEQYKETINL